MSRFLLLLFLMITSVAHAETCAEKLARFNADPRFHWSEMPEDLSRKPPNIYGSQMVALSYMHMEELPKGMSQDEAAFFGGIFRLLRDRSRVFELMRILSAEAEKTPLKKIFAEYEKEFGFCHEVVNELLPFSRLAALLARGCTFTDNLAERLEPVLGENFRAEPGTWVHIAMAHRLQLHLVLRDYKMRPEFYGNVKSPLEIYKRLGSSGFMLGLDWSHTGLLLRNDQEMFLQLFDNAENNASSPGFFLAYREYWPTLPIQ